MSAKQKKASLAAERQIVLRGLRTAIASMLPELTGAVVSQKIEGQLDSPVTMTYTLGEVRLGNLAVNLEDMDCEVRPCRASSLRSMASNPMRVSVEVLNLSAELCPIPFQLLRCAFPPLEVEGKLNVKVQSVNVWVDILLDLGEQPTASLQKIEVQLLALEVHAEARASVLYDLVLAMWQDQVREVVEAGLQEALTVQLGEQLPIVAKQLQAALATAEAVRLLTAPAGTSLQAAAKEALCAALGVTELGDREAQRVGEVLPALLRDHPDVLSSGQPNSICAAIVQLGQRGALRVLQGFAPAPPPSTAAPCVVALPGPTNAASVASAGAVAVAAPEASSSTASSSAASSGAAAATSTAPLKEAQAPAGQSVSAADAASKVASRNADKGPDSGEVSAAKPRQARKSISFCADVMEGGEGDGCAPADAESQGFVSNKPRLSVSDWLAADDLPAPKESKEATEGSDSEDQEDAPAMGRSLSDWYFDGQRRPSTRTPETQNFALDQDDEPSFSSAGGSVAVAPKAMAAAAG